MALLGELVSASSPRNGSRYQMIIKGCPKAGSDPHGDLQDLCTLPAAREVMEKHIMSLWLIISFLWEAIAPQLLPGKRVEMLMETPAFVVQPFQHTYTFIG